MAERLRTREDFERYRPDMFLVLSEWKTAWSPRRAAFALEIAIAAHARNWPFPSRYLAAARDIVTARPEPPGTTPEDDRFELLFHRAAVALLALDAPYEVEAYLSPIAKRVAVDGEPTGARLFDARLLLARAMALEVQTLSRRANDDRRLTWILPPNDGEGRKALGRIRMLLDAAAAGADARADALVRRAFVSHRLNAQQDALSVLDNIGPISDRMVDGWQYLVRGRVLAALNRPREAVAAYEQAAALAPAAQTAAVALAAQLLELGDREGAHRWATRARSTADNTVDPWQYYWMGDARLLPEWLAELRRSRP